MYRVHIFFFFPFSITWVTENQRQPQIPSPECSVPTPTSRPLVQADHTFYSFCLFSKGIWDERVKVTGGLAQEWHKQDQRNPGWALEGQCVCWEQGRAPFFWVSAQMSQIPRGEGTRASVRMHMKERTMPPLYFPHSLGWSWAFLRICFFRGNGAKETLS